jgi:hypothetical protein
MSTQNSLHKTQTIYKAIIDKLIDKMKEEASNEGCNEDTLRDLKIVININ